MPNTVRTIVVIVGRRSSASTTEQEILAGLSAQRRRALLATGIDPDDAAIGTEISSTARCRTCGW